MGKLKDLYAEIWEERPHHCVKCGMYIRTPIIHNFSHIRSKGARPDLKFDKDNIDILCSSINIENSFKNRIGCHELSHTNPEKFKNRKP